MVDNVHSVLFAGVPFGPGIGFIEDLHMGTATGFNKSLLSQAVLHSFSTTFTFFPETVEEQKAEGSYLAEQDGETRIEMDFFDVADWKRLKLGVFSLPPSALQASLSEYEEHLRFALSDAKSFRARLRHDAQGYPKMAVLAADQHPTALRVLRDGPKSVRGWDIASSPTKPGDGRVRFDAATPPISASCYRVFPAENNTEHSQLLSDTAHVGRILEWLSISE